MYDRAMHRNDLQPWIVEALRSLGGYASVVEVSRRVWELHEQELRDAGDMFYKWQYDIRHAATGLVETGVIDKLSDGWRLTEVG